MDAVFTEADLPLERTAIARRARFYILVRLVFDVLFLALSFLSVWGVGRYPTYWLVLFDGIVLGLYWLAVRRMPGLGTYIALLVPVLLIILLDQNQGRVLLFPWFLIIPLSIAGGLIMGRIGFNSLVTLSYLLVLGGYVASISRNLPPILFDLPSIAFYAIVISLGVVLLALNALVETLIVYGFQSQQQLVEAKAQLYQVMSELENSRQAMQLVQQRRLRNERLNTIGQVAAQMNKSIREPLKRLQQMLDSDSAESWNRETVQQIRQDLSDIVRVIEGLQHIAELKAPRFQPVSLDELVMKFVGRVQPPPGVSLHVKESVFPPAIQADAEQIQILLRHLLENAFQAVADTGGEVEITLQPSSDGVWLSVSDTGPGIPQEQLEQIFEPLFSTQQKGIGLGLVICQQIAHLHGGSIRAENLEGGGARFSVYLPNMPYNMQQEFVQDVSG